MTEALRERLLARRLVVVTGKGGVGKSTLTAALGAALADGGRRVLLLEADPRESLYACFDVEPSGGDIVATGRPGISVQNVQAREVLDRLVAERVQFGPLRDRITGSRLYDTFVGGAPGLKELALLGHAYRSLERDFDLVVLDAPATGHGLAMLEAPRLIGDAIAEGPIGELAGELADFVDDAARCGVLLVTAPEEMPVQETLELIEALGERRPMGVVVNGRLPDVSEVEPPTLWSQRAETERIERARLVAAWDGSTIDLPMLPLPTGPELIDALAARLR